jgi:DNA-binding MarR family transcriptional regulator
MTAPQPLSFWIRTMDSLLQEEFARAAEDADIDRGQWQVLTRLRLGGVADDVLRDGLAPFVADDDTVDSVVDRVVKDDLVEHQANEYRLTSRGLERVDEVEEKTLSDIHGRAFDGVTQEDEDHLLSTLERVATNLGWQPA